MTERRRKILALLWSLHDLLPMPHGALRSDRGLAPARRVPCPDCGLSETPGWRMDRFKRVEPCLTCGGRPATEGKAAKRGRGTVKVDPMDAQQEVIRTDHHDLPTRPLTTVGCDACGGQGVGGAHLRDKQDPLSEYRDPCERCGGSGRRTVSVFDLQLDRERIEDGGALEAALDKRREAGSYHELDEALQVLPGRWRTLLIAVHGERVVSLGELSELERVLVEAALAAVDMMMPEQIKVPGSVRSAWKRLHDREARTLAHGRGAGSGRLEKRDKEIRKLDREGKPRQWIAAEYGLSVDRVKRIVNGEVAA